MRYRNLLTYLLTYLCLMQIEFHKECGADNICEPELAVNWLNVTGVVVGSQSARAQVNADLQVLNTGETAYSVTLNVTFPRPSLQFAAAAPEHLVGHLYSCTLSFF